MPTDRVTFDIDDTKSVDDNLAECSAKLASLDPALAAVLISKLADWSRGKPMRHGELLDELYAATESHLEAKA